MLHVYQRPTSLPGSHFRTFRRSGPRFRDRLGRTSGGLLALLAAGLIGCATPESPEVAPRAPAAVAVADEYGAAAAEAVLREGGNAVDAAIATALVLAVTYPEAGNLGGGGFMLTFVEGQTSFLDYRETAPAAATKSMFLDEGGEVIPDLSLVGHLAAAVPATVAGLWAAHQRYGTKPWVELVAPAIRLAEEGFLPPDLLLERISDRTREIDGRTSFHQHFGSARSGEPFLQPELAATLVRIAELGRDGFYLGPTAQLIEQEMVRGGGLVTQEDLRAYQPVWREPLTAPWRDYQLVSVPPPSSGGFAVLQLLGMKDFLAAEFDGHEHNSAQYVHLVAEIEKRVFADRAHYLGDPDFVEVPVDRLIDAEYLSRRAREVDPAEISAPEGVVPGLGLGRSTTHFSILDAMGNAVSNTYTLNTDFGNGVVVEGAGFLLNNEMDDFSAKPGVPNYYGVVGSSANAVEAGKRMLSSMSPTLLLRDGRVAMVVGAMGGSTIFTSVFQTIVNIVDFGMSPSDAVAATRFHHQLLPPDLITYSPGRPLPEKTVAVLSERGYRVEAHPWKFGDVQVIWRDGERLVPASDPRARGVARVVDR